MIELIMIRVRVEFFAVLRERAGTDSEHVETGAGTAAELFAELAGRYAFPEIGSMKVAINQEFADWNSCLADGDSVVFIPPVAGG